MTGSELGDSGLPRADDHWCLAAHQRLQGQTSPLLAQVLKHLESLRADPMLPQRLHADARLIAISVAESAVLLDCLLESLADPRSTSVGRPPRRQVVRKQFFERALGELSSDESAGPT
jgi:hypothetical protein